MRRILSIRRGSHELTVCLRRTQAAAVGEGTITAERQARAHAPPDQNNNNRVAKIHGWRTNGSAVRSTNSSRGLPVADSGSCVCHDGESLTSPSSSSSSPCRKQKERRHEACSLSPRPGHLTACSHRSRGLCVCVCRCVKVRPYMRVYIHNSTYLPSGAPTSPLSRKQALGIVVSGAEDSIPPRYRDVTRGKFLFDYCV